MNKYLYETAEICLQEDGSQRIYGPNGFEASATESIGESLKALPNILQEIGGWETIGFTHLGNTIVFLLRKETSRVLMASGF